jgi:hypothetical protein
MDDIAYKILEKMNLPKIKLISLVDFESAELLRVKKERSIAEYSWTCASNFIWYLLQENKGLEHMIYLDADLYFFNDPKIIIEELGNKDVMITPHRYTAKYDQSKVSGKYCVQFMIFKNNFNGLLVLDWWRRACLEWCFSYQDGQRFGDQKYLDDWLTRFNNICELQHLGGGVAPWNAQQYHFSEENNKIIGREISSNIKFPLVFYHFHGFYFISGIRYFCVIGYVLSKNVRNIIYKTYFRNLKNALLLVKKIDHNFNFGFKNVNFKDRLRSYALNNMFVEKIYLKLKK